MGIAKPSQLTWSDETRATRLQDSFHTGTSCKQRHDLVEFDVRPISFSIPNELITEQTDLGRKHKVLAHIIPGQSETYDYANQTAYYNAYTESFFGVTFKKAGWDCLRHYEILAAGCLPYMPDVENLPLGTMFRWPRDVLKDVVGSSGVNHSIVHAVINGQESISQVNTYPNLRQIDRDQYRLMLDKLRNHMKRHLTTTAMAGYLMSFAPAGHKQVLFLGSPSLETHYPDYQAETLFHGLRLLYGNRVTDIPKRSWMYGASVDLQDDLYGRGYSYAYLLDDLVVQRDDFETRLSSRIYSLVIFAVMHHGRHPLIDVVREHYSPQNVFFVDGSDSGAAETNALYAEVCGVVGVCFRRELVCNAKLNGSV